MACDITSGRLEPCKNSTGGNKAAYFINFVEDAFTVSNGEATAINVAITEVFKYELRADGNTLEQEAVSDFNTGTTVITQTLNLALKKLDKDTNNEVKLMAHGRPIIVLQDRNDNYSIVGLTEGADLTSGTSATGGAKADFNGYSLTFVATEPEYGQFLDAATVTALQALVSATNIDPS